MILVGMLGIVATGIGIVAAYTERHRIAAIFIGIGFLCAVATIVSSLA